MSAKKSSAQPKPSPVPVATPAATGPGAVPMDPEAAVPWIESSNPRRRLIGQIALVVVWIYVAALCLLALDQWFNWGIFGPKIPPTP